MTRDLGTVRIFLPTITDMDNTIKQKSYQINLNTDSKNVICARVYR